MITVRSAVPDDAISIIEFQQKMALETENIHLDFHTVTKGLHAVFADTTKGAYYVAVDDDTVVGSLMTTYEWSDWRSGHLDSISLHYSHPSRARCIQKNV
jgi:hypothetical protein